MKKITILGILGSLFLLSSCGIGAKKYNDTIVNPSLELEKKSNELAMAKSKEDYEKLKNEIITISNKAIEEVEALDDEYNGNKAYKEKALEYYKQTKAFLKNDLVNKFMSANWDPSIAEKLTPEDMQSFEDMTAKLIESENSLVAEQQKFAQENEMTLQN